MKLAKCLLVLVMAFGLLAGCAGTHYGVTGGKQVDAVLLEEPEVEVPDPTTVRIQDKVLFDFDSYQLDDRAKGVVQVVAGLMQRYPDTVLILEGHTDKYGSAEYNQTLSEDRANAVENALVNQGVAPDRISQVTGFGKTQLIPNLTNRENRRVIILSIGE
jgi:outer membrane protein OmpA-like peptidoglycan-associated protein